MAKQRKGSPPSIDLSQIGKSKRLAKRNKDYLDLLSIVTRAREGFVIEQTRLNSKPAKESAKQLLGQLDLIYHMVSLPHATLMLMEGEAYFKQASLDKVLLDLSEEEKRKAFEKRYASTMQRFFAIDVTGSLSRPWLFAITVYIWTAFECLAGDLWVASLNHATKLGQRILSSIPHDDAEKFGLSRRHIDVGLAARYGFDLRRSLGTVLRSKFDFSSVDGIEVAYKQAFGIVSPLHETDCATLSELEQVRHLIVHRGGVADDKFLKLTKLKVRRAKILSLALSQVGDYMAGMTLGCVGLLKIVDKWFEEQK